MEDILESLVVGLSRSPQGTTRRSTKTIGNAVLNVALEEAAPSKITFFGMT